MSQTVIFKYGSGRVIQKMEGAVWAAPLTHRLMQPIEDVSGIFRRSLFQCIASPPLQGLIHKNDLITVVISDDGNYLAQQHLVLPILLESLSSLGVSYENMAVLVARGTHTLLDEEKLRELVPEPYFSRVRVECHDSNDNTLLTLGLTGRATPVRVNMLCAPPRKVILLSNVNYDIMSGFCGGPRCIMPGVCSRDGAVKNTSLALSPNAPCSHPRVGLGIIENNPVVEDTIEACAMVKPVFSINLVGDDSGRLCGIFSGSWRESWLQSCRMVMSYAGTSIPMRADIAFADCGGYPFDGDLRKAAAAIVRASRCVRNAGVLAFMAECRDGNGPDDFFKWVQSRKNGTLENDLRNDFTEDGYLFFALYEVTRRIRVLMLSKNVTTTTLNEAGIGGFRTIETMASNINMNGASIYTISDSWYTVPYDGN